jgi:hypothetical protein
MELVVAAVVEVEDASKLIEDDMKVLFGKILGMNPD